MAILSQWWPPIAWSGVILLLTSWPSPSVDFRVEGADKVVHFSVYAALGALVARVLPVPRTRLSLLAALAWITVFGLLDEVHQDWIPGREASVFDWAADTLGAAVGLLAAHRLLSLALRRQEQQP